MRPAVSFRFVFLFCLFGLAVAGCLDSASQNTSETKNPTRNPSYHVSVFIDDSRLELATIKKAFPRDEIIPLRISITNTGDKEVALTYPSGQKYEFLVTDGTGEELWRWSEGQVFTQAVQTVKVKPAETYNYFGSVPAGRLKNGKYKISGWLTADELLGEKLELNVTIE